MALLRVHIVSAAIGISAYKYMIPNREFDFKKNMLTKHEHMFYNGIPTIDKAHMERRDIYGEKGTNRCDLPTLYEWNGRAAQDTCQG